MRAGAIALAVLAMTGAAAAETVQLYAAGSLHGRTHRRRDGL